MRSIRLLAATTVILFGAAACGDDGNGPENQSPNASFTHQCTGLTCTFTDGSTDEDGNIASRAWTFASGNPASSTVSPQTVTFPQAGSYAVSLTVTDNEGATDNVSQNIPVTTGTTNTEPTASFELPPSCTAGTPCGFHSTSTDVEDGTITPENTAWNFGDEGEGTGIDVTHTYDEAGTYTVTLTVTDAQGATGTATQQLTVSEPTSQNCTTTGTLVDCSLTLSQQGRVTFTLVSESCELGGNTLRVTAPRAQTVFFNLCSQPVGQTYTLTDASGVDQVLTAGTVVNVRFDQGTPDPDDPPIGDPGIQIVGGSPSWTLNIDDGGAAGTPGEPDFNDAVVSVQVAP